MKSTSGPARPQDQPTAFRTAGPAFVTYVSVGCDWTSLPLTPHAPRGIAMAVPRNPNQALESLDAVFSDLSSKWAGYGLQPRYNAVEFTAEPGSAGTARR